MQEEEKRSVNKLWGFKMKTNSIIAGFTAHALAWYGSFVLILRMWKFLFSVLKWESIFQKIFFKARLIKRQ